MVHDPGAEGYCIVNALERIRRAARDGRYEITSHALEEAQDESSAPSDILNVLLHGRLAMRFTLDPRGVRYRLTGLSEGGRMLNVVCRFTEEPEVRIVTVYGEADAPEETSST
jgi:hypothetical protein